MSSSVRTRGRQAGKEEREERKRLSAKYRSRSRSSSQTKVIRSRSRSPGSRSMRQRPLVQPPPPPPLIQLPSYPPFPTSSQPSISYRLSDKANGLWFDDTHVVTRLSGPVSLRLLMPTVDPAVGGYCPPGSSCPVILLLGDVHFSEQGMCDQCEVSAGCYDLRTPELFQMLDSLGSLSFQTGVYLEYFDTFLHADPCENDIVLQDDAIQAFDNGVMKHTLVYAAPCVRAQGKRKFGDKLPCVTQRLKWHMSDVRIGQVKGRYASIEMFLGAMQHPNFGRCVMESDTIPVEVMSSVKTILKSIYNVTTQQISVPDFVHTFVDEIWLHHEWSLIAKQARKQSPTVSKSQVARLLERCMLAHLQNLERGKQEEAKQYFESSEFQQDVEHYFNPFLWLGKSRVEFAVFFFNCLLDVYTVLRMLKPSNDSLLAIAYLGDSHAQVIAGLLRAEFGYHIHYEIPDTANKRCLTITEPIDVGAMVNAVEPPPIDIMS